MACAYDYVAGDTATKHGPVTCKDKDGAVIDLTGATVRLLYRINAGALQTKNMTVLTPATNGKAEYLFLAGELIAGEMEGSVQITDASSKVVTETCTFFRTIRAVL